MTAEELEKARRSLDTLRNIDEILSWKPTKDDPGPRTYVAGYSSYKAYSSNPYHCYEVEEVIVKAILTSMRNRLAAELASLGVTL